MKDLECIDKKDELKTREDFIENFRTFSVRSLKAICFGALIFFAGQFYWWLGLILLLIFLIAFVVPDFLLVGVMIGLALLSIKLVIQFSPLVFIKGKAIPSKTYEANNYLVLQGLLTGSYGLFLLTLVFSLLISFFYDLI